MNPPDASDTRFALSERVLIDIVIAHDNGSEDGAHDLHHLRRVWHNCEHIGGQCEAHPDWQVLSAAAYLHDLINVPKNSPDRARASTISADAAIAALSQRGFPATKRDAVHHAIQAHSFSAGFTPETLEACILQDADRLDALGALGLARTFYVAANSGHSCSTPKTCWRSVAHSTTDALPWITSRPSFMDCWTP